MSENKNTNSVENEEEVQQQAEEQVTTEAEATQEEVIDEQPTIEQQLQDANSKIAELEDKNLRMMAEFDNYRRRTNKEKLELIATAGENIFKDMLPMVDDIERALAHLNSIENEQVQEFKEGVNLIYKKFTKFLEDNHVTAIDTCDAVFNTDEHEAITTLAAGEEKKGKVIDCTKKGYKLGEKVIRFAQVVVGE